MWTFSITTTLQSVHGALQDSSGATTGKESICQCTRRKRRGFDPWVRRAPREGNGNPHQYSCLGNPMDRGAWRATVHGVAESDATEHARCIVPRVLVISCHASASFGVFAGRESGIHGFSRHDTSFFSVPNLLLSLAHTHTHALTISS